MRFFLLILVFSLIVVLVMKVAGERGLTVRVDLSRTDPGEMRRGGIQVRMQVVGHGAESLLLTRYYGSREVRVHELRARDAAGLELKVAAPIDTTDPAATFAVAPSPSGAAITLEYSVTFERGAQTTGEGGDWTLGHAGSDEIAAPLAALVFLPRRRAKISCAVDLGPDWSVVRGLFEGERRLDRELLENASVVAVRGVAATRALAGGAVTLRAPAGRMQSHGDRVEELVDALITRLGRPLEPLELTLLRGPEPAVLTDLTPGARHVAIDLRGGDQGDLRRLLRRLVPAWWGHRFEELDSDPSTTVLVPLGVTEYLAQRLAAEACPLARDWVGPLEISWFTEILEPCYTTRATDLRTRRRRRIAGALLVHEAVRTHEEIFGATASLADILGSRPGELPTLGATRTHPAVLADPGFLHDWMLDLERRTSATLSPQSARSLLLRYTADLHGAVDGCPCASPAGGAAQRSFELEAGARAGRTLTYDLGNFSSRRFGGGDDPEQRRTGLRMLASMLATHYDAVVPGSEDVYSALGFPAWSVLNQRISSFGLDGPGAGSFRKPRSTRLEGADLTVAFLGYSELLDAAAWHDREEERMHGIGFPDRPDDLIAAIAELAHSVDLVVVGGRMRPSTIRLLAATDLVDVILAAGLPASLTGGDPVGFLGRTLVSVGGATDQGYRALDLVVAEGAGGGSCGVVDFVSRPLVHVSVSAERDQDVLDALERVHAGQLDLGRLAASDR